MKSLVLYFSSILLCGFFLVSCKEDSTPVAPVQYSVPSDSLQAYYMFDQNTADSSGHGRDGIATNVGLVADRFDHGSSAYYLNGTASHIELGTWFNYPYFTFSLWVKPDSIQNRWADIIENNHTNSRSWNLQQDTTASNHMSFGVCISPSATTSGAVILNPGVWQHVVCEKDSLKLRVYLNGTLVSSVDHIGPTVYDGTEHLGLGRWYNSGYMSRFWKGGFDDVRLYNRALTENEVMGLYHERGW